MSDWYGRLATNPRTKGMVRSLGLPVPARLRRHEPGASLLPGPALVGGSGRVRAEVERLLEQKAVEVATGPPEPSSEQKLGALIYDATGVADAGALGDMFEFFNAGIRSLGSSGRFLVIGEPPCDVEEPSRGAAMRALEGFVRSAGKEMRGGSTANLIRVSEGAETDIASTLFFFLSGRSAYVSGQPVVLTPADAPQQTDPTLADQTVCVTGAARGIGAAIAEVMAREGAHVICLDIPAQGTDLARTANRVGGTALQLDITAEDASRRLVEHIESRHGGIDVIVHNAGITRDKTLAGMDRPRWDTVLDVNLLSQERIDAALLESDVLAPNGRIVSVSSVSGIAGNRGQTNYAASKAGVIGRVKALAPQMRERGGTVNAVAPGFIETAMTARMPFGVREAGRRMNSLSQGGLPIDVAETIAWLADPATAAVNGNVVRVCGQSLIGA